MQTFPPLLPPHPGYEPTGPRDVWLAPVLCFAVGGPACVVALWIPPPTPVSPKSIKTDRAVGSGELEGGMRGGRARVEGAECLPREGNQGDRSTAARLGPSLPELPHTSTRWAKDFLSPLSKVPARVSPAGQQGHHLGSACMWLWGPGREWAHLLLAAGVGGGEGCLQASRDGLCCAQGQLESWAVFCPLSVPSPASWGPGRTVHALCLQAKALQPRYPRLREEPLASRGRHWGPHRVLGRGFGAPGLQAPQGLCPVCAPHGKTLRTLAPSGPEGAP